jgi:F420-non-reducing hydrogenase iron-sulfur subunit
MAQTATFDFEPLIIGFCCNWCSYAGADLAGTSRYEYPPNIRIIRVMCTQMIPPWLVVDALTKGADGVLITGCHPGDCHYIDGNLKAQRRVEALAVMLQDMGLEPERLKLEWVSAGEGEKFAKVVRDFTDGIRKLGPNPFK